MYLPMHSVTDWPVLVAFVKLNPNQISETNIIYHTENGESSQIILTLFHQPIFYKLLSQPRNSTQLLQICNLNRQGV